MKVLLILIALSMFGCVSITPDHARNMLDSELCKKYGRPINSAEADRVIVNEIRSRGIDCSPYWRQQAIEAQQSLQLMDMGLRTLTTPVQQPQKPVNCFTNCPYGNPYNCFTTCY